MSWILAPENASWRRAARPSSVLGRRLIQVWRERPLPQKVTPFIQMQAVINEHIFKIPIVAEQGSRQVRMPLPAQCHCRLRIENLQWRIRLDYPIVVMDYIGNL